ncbi:MAG: flagellar basal body rod protein FlgB [Gallionellaceae bacterium]|nr:flagellar basal body rod protein FlgB [Gallionellaceae bacterium]
MLSKIDHEFAFIQTAMSLRARRQEILASNLANSDTPNYKARDLDFASALRSAVGASGGTLALATTSAGHIGGMGTGGAAGAAGVKYRSVVQPSLDGNTVDPDVERGHFADNAMQYQFLLERMRGTVEKMKMALSETR